MLEKPAIQESLIKDCLENQYGLQIITLEFLPIGNDVNSAVYRVLAKDNSLLYLKLRSGEFNKVSVIIPQLLQENGVKQVIAPILTKNQQEWTMLNEYSMALYPYIGGQNGFVHPLSDLQWIKLGETVKGLHSLKVTRDLLNNIPKEEYSSVYRNDVKNVIKHIHEENYVDNVAVRLVEFMKKKEKEITHMVERSEELSVALKSQTQEFVLCHADLHGANILIDETNEIYIIDWDTLLFAPKERDLMFIGGGIGGVWNIREEEELFYKGYGKAEINHTALTYYRYERIVQDIAEFSKRLLFTSDGGKDRKSLLEKFIDTFLPNNVVEIAIREENFEPR